MMTQSFSNSCCRTNQAPISNLVNHVEHHVLGGNPRENNAQPPKMVPRNVEYLERQSKISDIRGGPSPAQASDAPESNQLHTPFRQHQLSNVPAIIKPPPIVHAQAVNNLQTTSESHSANNNLSSLTVEPIIRRVTVNAHRLREMDIDAMTDSIKDFKFHLPDRALKLGIVRNSGDMFTKMKATGNDDNVAVTTERKINWIFFCITEVKTMKRRLPDRDDEIVQCKKKTFWVFAFFDDALYSFPCSF